MSAGTRAAGRRAFVVALGLFFSGCAGPSGSNAETGSAAGAVVVGRPLPELTLKALDGTAQRLSAFRGRVVLLDVWASWCEPCKDELPVLDGMAADLRARGVEVLAVSLDQEADNVHEFLKRRRHWTLRVFHDPTGAVAETLQPPKMPTSYVLDRGGVVRRVNLGFSPGDAADIRRELQTLAAR